MSDPTPSGEPFDLSSIDDRPSAASLGASLPMSELAPHAVVPAASQAVAPAIAPLPAATRLVEVANLPPEDLAEARERAARIDFRAPLTLLDHGNGALQELAVVSRRLLADRTVGDAGELGRIAAAVLDGIKVLRLEDLQREAGGEAPARHGGLLARMAGFALDARGAVKGFAENRKRFLALMDAQEAQARRALATLKTDVVLVEQLAEAARRGIRDLKLDIAAAQIALDRGYAEEEALRQRAVASGDPADAAEVMDFRSALANFTGKAGELRTALVRAATIIPTVGNTRRAAETRIMKLSNGLLVVIPNLMAAAAMAAAQADIRGAARQGERLEEADRQVALLAAKGAHEAATSAARSLGTDPRNVETLAAVARQAVATLHEVMTIEQEVAAQEREAEKNLVEVRDGLVTGMQGVQRRALAPR